jgi:PAS domain S-box-containing protein
MLMDSQSAPTGAEQVFEDLYDPAFLIDPEQGRFVGANAAACAFLGYGSEELLNLTPADIHPHEIPRLDAFLEAVREHSRWSTNDLACRARDGMLIPAQVRASLVRLEGRDYIAAIVRDRREEELAELGRSIRKLAHDLRNTMVSSRLMSDRLRRHDDPLVQRSAELIARSVDRAVRMCQDALDAGTSAEKSPQLERFRLDDVSKEVIAAIGPEEAVGATLEAPGLEHVSVEADFDQLFRILLNLVRNSLGAGARHVRLTAAQTGDIIAIDVTDDGPGIPADKREHLFEDRPHRPGEDGAGLGLAIARELATNHSGDLELVSTGPEGTTFRISLPASQPLSQAAGAD